MVDKYLPWQRTIVKRCLADAAVCHNIHGHIEMYYESCFAVTSVLTRVTSATRVKMNYLHIYSTTVIYHDIFSDSCDFIALVRE